MAIEVIERGPQDWTVYFSLDKEEKCSCSQEWWEKHWPAGCGEVAINFDTQQGANYLASWLRFKPGAYEIAVAHWTTTEEEPRWIKACGCHEHADGWWHKECDFEEAWERARNLELRAGAGR